MNSGQEYSLEFIPISSFNDLKTREVRRLMQDNEGYIWIVTTSGLYSYDSYQVKTYKSTFQEPDLLTNNRIACIVEDEKNRLYIGTNSGLNILDKKTGSITHVNHPESFFRLIENILPLENNIVYIGTSSGLYVYDMNNDSCYVFSDARDKKITTSISRIFRDSKGQIWIGSYSEGLFRYDSELDLLHEYPRITPHNNQVQYIFEDYQGQIWIGGFRTGLFLLKEPYDIQYAYYVSFDHDPSKESSLCDNHVYVIEDDPLSGTLWVGTRGGLSIMDLYNPQLGFVNYTPGSKENPLPFNEVNAVLRDRQGNMWLGMLGGGIYYVRTNKSKFESNRLLEVQNTFSSNSIRSLFVDDEDRLWLGIGGYGFMIENPDGKGYTYWDKLPGFSEDMLRLPMVNAIIQTRKKGEIYLGTFGAGVYIYDVKSEQPALTSLNDIYPWLKYSHVHSLKEDSYGNIWCGTRNGIGYITPEGESYHFSPCYIDGKNAANSTYLCIEEISPGTIWAGTNNLGVIRMTGSAEHPQNIMFEAYSPDNGKLNCANVQCIHFDSRGRLWLGTEGGGLNLYDPEQDCFISVNTLLNIPADAIFSMEEDEKGNLWLGTSEGLISLDVRKPLENSFFSIYTTSSGLLNHILLPNASAKKKDGEMYFGGHNGYNSFFPCKITNEPDSTLAAITDIKINNESWGKLELSERVQISEFSPNFTERIVLNHNQNNILLEFSAFDYINPKSNKYAYCLFGQDKQWQITDASRRFASYNNLSPGSYVFRVRSMGENGRWGEKERVVSIEVLAPFWATGWAYCIYVFVFATIIYFSYRTASNRLYLRSQLRLGMIEKQQAEELNQVKLQFYTNVTHELLTPLTIISATVDSIKNQNPHLKESFVALDSNIRRLMALLQQILEFRKAESGNLQLRVSYGDLSAFVRDKVELFRPLVKKKQLHISFVSHPETITGYFDTDKMDKILYNLLSNASKYNHEGGFIQVTTYISDDNNFVELRVKDGGVGLTDKQKDKLFERFYEGDHRRFNTIGTGIGLSLTRDLVNLHGGDIRVESKSGAGSIFIVTLPIEHSFFKEEEIFEKDQTLSNQSEITVTEHLLENELGRSMSPKENYSLLLVEDNEELLQVMVRLLEPEYRVFTAFDGREAVNIVDKEEIDLIISDVMMPLIDGVELCRYLKGKIEFCHIPIILLTAKNKEEDRAEAYESGADAFISKPFNTTVLHARIKNLLRARKRVAQDFKKQLVFEMKDLNYTSLDEDFLQRAIDCVNEHLNDSRFDQVKFIELMGTTKSTLYRKLKSLTGLNTSAFICNIRLKAACRIIENTKQIRISELAYAVGFNDPKYFNACFKKEFGILPSEYIERFTTQNQQS